MSYMVLRNDKIINNNAETIDDAQDTIRIDFKYRKHDDYVVISLSDDEPVDITEFLLEVRVDKTPVKKIKIPRQKQYDPNDMTNNSMKERVYKEPKQRKPLPRSQKRIPQRRDVQRVGKNDIIDDSYSVWLGTKPCLITGAVSDRGAGPNNIHCHHVKGRRPRNDYNQVPLMGTVHAYGGMSYHELGPTMFLDKWKKFLREHNQDTLNGVYDIVEFFEDHAAKFKEEYDELQGGL